MHSFRLLSLLMLGLLAMGLLLATGDRPVSAQGNNLLANPSFEGQYTSYVPETAQEVADCPRNVCTTAQLALGWKPWWVKERPTDVNPEYKPAEANASGNRVRSGSRAAQYFSFWSTHKAGLRQTVTVPTNAFVQFSVWGHAWLSESDTSLTSDFSGTPNMRVGIDPTGGANVYSPSIVWSEFKQVYDNYDLFTVQAQAQGERVTVFTFSAPSVNPNSPDYGFKHTDVYWDDASLTAAGGSAPAPPPPPADTGTGSSSGNNPPPAAVAPQITSATATPDADGVIYSEVGPGDSIWAIAARAGLTLDQILELNQMSKTDVVHTGDRLIVGHGEPPAAEEAAEADPPDDEPANDVESGPVESTPVPTPDAKSTGIAMVAPDESGVAICLKAFDDINRNGQHDSGEDLRSAVAFTISDGQSVVSNYVTDGESEPFCVSGLKEGSYRVARSSINSEVMTTPGDRSVSLTEGGTLSLEFGSYVSEETIAVANAAGQAGDTTADAGGITAAAVAPSDGAEVNTVAIVAVVVAVLLLVGVLIIILSARRTTT